MTSLAVVLTKNISPTKKYHNVPNPEKHYNNNYFKLKKVFVHPQH